MTATIFGTKASVCSFICVVAWNIETISPTTMATKSIGAAESMTVKIASLITVIIVLVETKSSHPRPYRRYYPKLSTMTPIISCHPSTSTNNKTLNGSDIIAGGSIIIPIAIKVLATTISMTINGRYMKKPI